MRKILFVCFLFFIFFSIGCKNEIDYLLINDSSFDITIVDSSSQNLEEYFIEKKSSKTIQHYDSGNFILKENIYPVDIKNYFSCTKITDKPSYNLFVKNTTKNDISFSIPENYINNDFYIESESEKEFTIYVFPDIVCNYQFYSISERNKQFFIVFY